MQRVLVQTAFGNEESFQVISHVVLKCCKKGMQACYQRLVPSLPRKNWTLLVVGTSGRGDGT